MPIKPVSIITVNYNGKKYLKNFLDSTQMLDYPKSHYEVIVVDNGSTDGSQKFVKQNFPGVRLIASKKNLGFGGGNNLGMKNAKGKLFFLVNNDTVLEKNSLSAIVSTFERWSKKTKVGAVNAKMVLIDSYLPIVVEEASFSSYILPSGNPPLNSDPFVMAHHDSHKYGERVFVPYNHKTLGTLNLLLKLKPYLKSGFRIFIKNKLLFTDKFRIIGSDFQAKIVLPEKIVKKYKVDLIQNAGNFYFRDGYGRDRGAIVLNQKQYYESDDGQYDREELVPGFCGAGVLLNKNALTEVGYFDEEFFMYYEDGDLSFRLKAKKWNIVYSPRAVVRHIHAGSSKEWSDFFVFNVERGRLLFLAKHWPRIIVMKEWLKYIIKDTIGIPIYFLLRNQKKMAVSRFRARLKVNASLFPKFFSGLFRTERLSYTSLKKFL